jgi:hypothetical protein
VQPEAVCFVIPLEQRFNAFAYECNKLLEHRLKFLQGFGMRQSSPGSHGMENMAAVPHLLI